jgi:hypothetical protein
MKFSGGRINDEGCGMGMGFNPGGALGGPGDGVATGPPAAYGFVRKDVSDVMESIGSRSIGCFPARFEDGGDRLEELSAFRLWPLPSRGERGSGGAPVRGSFVGMFVWVTGGWLWKRQKMW